MKPIEFCLPNMTLRGFTNENIDAPLLLCLHGWLDNAASFTPLNSFLTEYHVITIDLPGHGLSDHRSSDAYYHFIDWLSDLVALFDHNQWDKVTLVGHSMGGMIATAFCAAFPDRVEHLILLDSIGFIISPENKTTEQLRHGLLTRSTYKARKKYYQSIDAAINARLKVSDLRYEHAALIITRSLQESSNGFSWRYDKKLQLMSPYRFSKAQAIDLIKHINCRCLFIGGENGADFIKSSLMLFTPLFKNISCYHLVGGHHIHMEEPEQVSKIINNFLN